MIFQLSEYMSSYGLALLLYDCELLLLLYIYIRRPVESSAVRLASVSFCNVSHLTNIPVNEKQWMFYKKRQEVYKSCKINGRQIVRKKYMYIYPAAEST